MMTDKRLFYQIALLMVGLLVMGCSMSSEPPPPIVGLRPTPTSSIIHTPTPQIASSQVYLLNLVNQAQVDRMMVHITTLVNFRTRHVNSSQDLPNFGIGASADYLLEQMQTIARASNGNFSVFEHPFTATYNNVTTPQRNIVGVLQGNDADAGVIVVGAHYDSRSWNLRDFAAFAPGADDNASGVAGVLEIARIMSQTPRRATILFVLFSAEEVGRQGSIAFVQDYLVAFDMDDVIMLNLDTIGSWNDSQGNINSQDIRLFSAPPNTSADRHIARTLNFMGYHHRLDLNIVLQDALDRPDRYGDHFSFQEAGYPALRFIEALEDHDNREGADTPEHIETAYLMASVRTILGVLEGLSDGIRPPQNISFRNLGDGTASVAWEPPAGATGYVVALRKSDSLIFDRHFIIETNRTAPWDGWWDFDSFAIATIDSRGIVGRFSVEVQLSR